MIGTARTFRGPAARLTPFRQVLKGTGGSELAAGCTRERGSAKCSVIHTYYSAVLQRYSTSVERETRERLPRRAKSAVGIGVVDGNWIAASVDAPD